MKKEDTEFMCSGTQTMKPIYKKNADCTLELIGWAACGESKVQQYIATAIEQWNG